MQFEIIPSMYSNPLLRKNTFFNVQYATGKQEKSANENQIIQIFSTFPSYKKYIFLIFCLFVNILCKATQQRAVTVHKTVVTCVWHNHIHFRQQEI